ncbi:hypothetical protein HDU67_008142 [Dinochytrium kinnereticum]|nr:hypothetical protein HDU67_008142 [Dinochytrium kinnereticum]
MPQDIDDHAPRLPRSNDDRQAMFNIFQRGFKTLKAIPTSVDRVGVADLETTSVTRVESAGRRGKKMNRLSDQQRSRVGRLFELFQGLHSRFETLETAANFFQTAHRNPEYLILKYELISLSYIAELCVCYEELAIDTGKRIVRNHPGVVERLQREMRDSEGRVKRLVVLPVRSVGGDGMIRWSTTSEEAVSRNDRSREDVRTPPLMTDTSVPVAADSRPNQRPTFSAHQPPPPHHHLQMQTRCLLLNDDEATTDPILTLLSDHGSVLAELWQSYKQDDVAALHGLLESLTIPPRVVVVKNREEKRGDVFGSLGLRRRVFERFLGLVERGEGRNERWMVGEVFGGGVGTDGLMISFVIWMCVVKVHGDRLEEEEQKVDC